MSNRLKIYSFRGGNNPLQEYSNTRQGAYLFCYLSDLDASIILEETHYFDRDYLSEFSAFYGVSSRGYPNICKRLHFFSFSGFNRNQLRLAAGGSKRVVQKLNESYLGFVIIRPIPSAPFGRTVLRWYSDQTPTTPRVIEPSRDYRCHIAGFTLNVHGLAWQQQDTGVSACATIALWTMLHSSAFSEQHRIPTTTEITKYAHRTASLGARVFPSAGLTIYQMLEAIKECGLAPVVCEGDIEISSNEKAFSRPRFSSLATSLIRSGYPVLIVGRLEGEGGHAVCAVGFRECSPLIPTAGEIVLQDGGVDYFYLHDDNMGPRVRFKVIENNNIEGHPVKLVREPPPQMIAGKELPDSIINYPAIIPSQIVAAVHNDLRTSPDTLHEAGITTAKHLCNFLNLLPSEIRRSDKEIGLTLSFRLIRLSQYLDNELDRIMSNNPKLLSRIRLALCEKVPPISLHVGVVRIGWGMVPLIDILYDTTDSDRNLPVFCNIAFNSLVGQVASSLSQKGHIDFGISIPAY